MVPDVKWKSHPNHPESTLLRFNAALALKVSVASLPAGSEQIKQLAVRTKGCTRQGSTNSTQNRPKSDPRSTPHRPRAPPGRPGGPRARFRTRFRVPGPPPRLTGRLRGVPKSASENPVVSPGGVPGGPRERLGRLGDARRAPRGQCSACLATREARSCVPRRFRGDFRAISSRLSVGFASAVDAAEGVVARRADLEFVLRFPTRNAGRTFRARGEKRPKIDRTSLRERSRSESRGKSPKIAPNRRKSVPKSTRRHSERPPRAPRGASAGAPGRSVAR